MLRSAFTTILITLIISPGIKATEFLKNDSLMLNKSRLRNVIIGEAALYSGLVLSLNNSWYKSYPRSPFHTFNDNSEWLQMDKCGHALSAYYSGRFGAELLKSCGVSEGKALVFGGNLGWFFLGSIEILDGLSSQWGFSWGDIAANSFGSTLFISQEWFLKKQLFTLKFSYYPSIYAPYRPNVLGSNFAERFLKDYNGQTYWLSCNVHDLFYPEIPEWLNLAIGYGADGMTGGTSNPLIDSKGATLPVFKRQRQYYLSLDIDLTKIKTNNKLLKTCLKSVGWIKFPAPAIELEGKGIKFHYLYF